MDRAIRSSGSELAKLEAALDKFSQPRGLVASEAAVEAVSESSKWLPNSVCASSAGTLVGCRAQNIQRKLPTRIDCPIQLC